MASRAGEPPLKRARLDLTSQAQYANLKKRKESSSVDTPPSSPQSPNYDDIDFKALAEKDEEFAAVLSKKGHLDFSDAKAVQQLTRSLLKRDFGLKIELPDDRLCPPVPVRYNYVRWIQRLVDTTSAAYTDTYDPRRRVGGIDIGAGASAVYALLACSMRANWTMCGTDLDPYSLSFASRNIHSNGLDGRISLRSVKAGDPFFAAALEALGGKADFTMCNPPFYASEDDMMASMTGEGKAEPPSAVCTGSVSEMVTPGGDVGFVLRMVEESMGLGHEIQWFSSMFGKLDSARRVVARLKEIGVTNWAVTCLRAGEKTRRWAVAWSWGDARPSDGVARGSGVPRDLWPLHTEFEIGMKGGDDESGAIGGVLDATLSRMRLRWNWDGDAKVGLVMARENVWSRAARRRREREKAEGGGMEVDGRDDDDWDDAAMVMKIVVEEKAIRLGWMRGCDGLLVESFTGMLRKRLKEAADADNVNCEL